MAEREGFEPSIEFPLYTLSKRAPSTTRPSLHVNAAGEKRSGCSEVAVFSLAQADQIVTNPQVPFGIFGRGSFASSVQFAQLVLRAKGRECDVLSRVAGPETADA